MKVVGNLQRHALVFAAACVFAAAMVSTASSVAAGSPGGPIVIEAGPSGSGYPIDGSGPTGITIRFIDHGSFWVAVVLRNRSTTQTATLEVARIVEPPNSLVHQTGATFARYHPCNGSRACPFPDFSQPGTPGPLTLQPGQMASIQFHYRLVSCQDVARSTTASATDLTVSYSTDKGAARDASFPLGGATLHLRKPAGVECLPRPFSHIGLVGSFTTSPGHLPVPGSDGDTCTRTTGGGLAFKSRLFMDRSGVEFRISINLPHYRGPGRYQPASRPGNTLGTADVTATGGFGLHGWTSFHNNTSTVTLTSNGTTLSGHLDAVFSGHRRFFHAYGTWRCTLLH